jgi:hypothetical protein
MSMIVTTKAKQYENPSEGEHVCVLADVIDLGTVQSSYGPREKVRLVWLVSERGTDGKLLSVVQTFNKTLHEKSGLRKALKSILGTDPGDTFDLEKLVGVNARLVIEHNEHDGKVYANVTAILRLPKDGVPIEIPNSYVRRKDRDVQLAKPGELEDRDASRESSDEMV